MGGRGSSSGMSQPFRSGQRYENEYMNVFIRRVNSAAGTVRFIEGYSPSAIHNAQEIPISELRKYLKRHGYKLTGYYD